MPVHYFYLVFAIFCEVAATSALHASEQFTRFWPSLLVISGYVVSFYFLSLTLRFMPVGLVYAIWAGLGIALIGLVGWIVYGQKLDTPAVLGMGLIVSGVLVIHLFSNSASH